MIPLKAGALYFAAVFGAGFALGIVRVLLFVPRVGERTAELLETPIMLLVSFVAARWVVRRMAVRRMAVRRMAVRRMAVRRMAVPPTAAQRLGIGCVALALLLVVEFGFVLQLRGLTLAEYFATRDPVSGAVYYGSLLLFALMPLAVRYNPAGS